MDPKETAVARQRLYKHVSTATDTHATIEEILEALFSVLSLRGYIARAILLEVARTTGGNYSQSSARICKRNPVGESKAM
jgi:hypothetical protein